MGQEIHYESNRHPCIYNKGVALHYVSKVLPILKTDKQWFCTQDGNYDTPTHMHQISATLSDGTRNITATLFDRAASFLLGVTCTEVLTKQAPNVGLHTMVNREAMLHLQAHKDNKTSIDRCIVNRAAAATTN